MQKYLEATPFIDFNNQKIKDFLKDIQLTSSPKENAILLYEKIRDHFIYDPYNLDLTLEGLKASTMVTKKRAWCVEKATLLIACCRAVGIPARPGYAIVKNHIGVDRLTEILRSEEIVFHGYADLFIEGKWVKATPAFDYKICRITGVEPLEFDGENDSLFQEFSRGEKFMEYIYDYGVFDDVPLKKMNEEMKQHYPHLFKEPIQGKNFKFNPSPEFLDPQN